MIVQLYELSFANSTNIRLPDIGSPMAMITPTSDIPVNRDGKTKEGLEDSPTRDIEIVEATIFNNLFLGNEIFLSVIRHIVVCS
jgi:hypothetical protein